MKLPKIKKSTLVILVLLAVFAVIALMTTPLLDSSDKKPSPDFGNAGGDTEQNGNTPNHASPSKIGLLDNTDVPEKSYTAAEIGDSVLSAESTKPYTTVYLPNGASFGQSVLPEGQWITLFGAPCEIDTPTRAEKAEFLNDILTELPDRIHFPLSITVSEDKIPSPTASSQILTWKDGNFSISAFFGSHYTYIDISVADHFHKFQLDNQAIAVDQGNSDTEIADSLKNIRLNLCEILGVNLQDTKIVRTYDGKSEYGATYLDVYFYNKESHPTNTLNDSAPRSDYIRLSFDNDANWKGDCVSNKVLTNVSISFVKYYSSNSNPTRTKMISLEKAEEMLKKGHVFGFHSCELCQDKKNAVDFSDYTHVSLIYKITNDGRLLPFYAFYKALGEAENETTQYALTYVPAFEVSDAEAYFEGQKEKHKNAN